MASIRNVKLPPTQTRAYTWARSPNRGARSGERAKGRGSRLCHLSAAAIAGVVVAAAVPEAAGARAEVIDAVRLVRPLRQARPVPLPAAVAGQPHPPHRPCKPRIRPVTPIHVDPRAVRTRRSEQNNYRERGREKSVLLPSRPVSGSAPRPASPSPPPPPPPAAAAG